MSQPLRASLLGPGFWQLSRSFRRLRAKARGALRSAARAGLITRGGSVLVLSAVGASTAAGDGNDPFKDAPLVRPQQQEKTLGDFGHEKRRVTDAFMLLNAVCFVLQWASKDILTLWGCKINELIFAGQWWRLITSNLLHANILHMAINTHALHTLGPQVEVVSGGPRTAAIYILSGIVATTASLIFCSAPSLGASGCVFGLGAALGVFYARHQDILGAVSEQGLQSLGVTLALNAGYSLINRKIDNWGHAGGLAAGALLAWLLGPALVIGANMKLRDQPPLPWMAFKHERDLRAQVYRPKSKAVEPTGHDRLGSSPAAPPQRQPADTAPVHAPRAYPSRMRMPWEISAAEQRMLEGRNGPSDAKQ